MHLDYTFHHQNGIVPWTLRNLINLLLNSESGLDEARNREKYIAEFYQNVKVWFRENNLKRDLKYDNTDNVLLKALESAKKTIHGALCDNFNTPVVIKKLIELISKTYEYEAKTKGSSLKLHLIYSVAKYVAKITQSFGLIYRTEFIDYFILGDNQQSSEEVLAPYIEALTNFRDNIKSAASIDKDLIKVLKTCDQLRDEVLPYLGVKIEDKGKGVPSIWKFYDKEIKIKREKELAEQARKKKEEEAKERELKVLINIYYFSFQLPLESIMVCYLINIPNLM